MMGDSGLKNIDLSAGSTGETAQLMNPDNTELW